MPSRAFADHCQRGLHDAADAESAWLEHHLTRFDLRQVQDVVEQLEQVPARVPDVAQILVLALVDLAEHAIQQHLGEADHRVQRGPQFVGHAGQELRLVAAGDLELHGLGLQLPEQACVDDGQRRLGGEALEQLGHLGRESPDGPAPDHQHAHHLVAAQQGDREHRAPAVPEQDVQMRVELLLSQVGDLERLRARVRPDRPEWIPGRW